MLPVQNKPPPKKERHELLLPLGSLVRLKALKKWAEYRNKKTSLNKADIIQECGAHMALAYACLIGFSNRVFEYRKLMDEATDIVTRLPVDEKNLFSKKVNEVIAQYQNYDFKELKYRIEDINMVL